jgi:hypothetical protein
MLPLKGRFGIALNLVLAVLALAGACIILFRGPGHGSRRLEIRDASSGRVYVRRPIQDGGEFAIEFVHSVNRSPVREIFRVRGTETVLVAVRFFSFGAGMQSDLEEGQVMSRDGDALVITGFDRSFEDLNYIVGTVSDHLLLINGETVSLRDLCGRNAHIKIRIR